MSLFPDCRGQFNVQEQPLGLLRRPVAGRAAALPLPVEIPLAVAGPEEESAESESESGQRPEGRQQSEVVVAALAVAESGPAEKGRAGEGAREAGSAPNQEGISQR